MSEMEAAKEFRRQQQQRAANRSDQVIGPTARESSPMDAFVQRAEHEVENEPVQHDRGRKPQTAAARPHQKPGCEQQAGVDPKLQEAARVRSLRQPPHGLAVKAAYRDRIDIHHGSRIGTCTACGSVCARVSAAPPFRAEIAAIAGAAAPTTYQAGANTEPDVLWVSQVRIAGANPPKTVIAVL